MVSLVPGVWGEAMKGVARKVENWCTDQMHLCVMCLVTIFRLAHVLTSSSKGALRQFGPEPV